MVGLGHGAFGPEERRAWGVAGWRSANVMPESLAAYGGAPLSLRERRIGGRIVFWEVCVKFDVGDKRFALIPILVVRRRIFRLAANVEAAPR